jgi:hypothetical protein
MMIFKSSAQTFITVRLLSTFRKPVFPINRSLSMRRWSGGGSDAVGYCSAAAVVEAQEAPFIFQLHLMT